MHFAVMLIHETCCFKINWKRRLTVVALFRERSIPLCKSLQLALSFIKFMLLNFCSNFRGCSDSFQLIKTNFQI